MSLRRESRTDRSSSTTKTIGVSLVRGQIEKARLDGSIGNGIGLKLLIDPDGDAVFEDFVDVAGARSKREAIENVDRALMFVEFRIGADAGRHEQGDQR